MVATSASALAGIDLERHRLGGDHDPRAGGAGLGRDADAREQVALLLRSASSTPSSRLTRAGRNATRDGAGSVGLVSTAPGATRPPAHSAIEARRAVGPEAGQAMLLALLEPEACLGSEGVAGTRSGGC